MTETNQEALKDTEAAPGAAALLELGLVRDMPDAEAMAAALPQFDSFSPIGYGGMGVVWRARQIQLDRTVAIKLLRPELAADPSFAERFAREARALAKLQHPGIVAVHDYGEVLGLYYLVMEYVEGTDLRSLLEPGITSEQALAIVPQLCDALQYAHDEGVVHRDIKPENILVDRRGRIRIADFGLAKLRVPGSGRATSSGRILGTPHYMAPEQIDRPADVDHRADIFALGVVIYEMLTGKLPIGRFQAPSRVRPVDVRLDDVVMRSLEHDRERRFQHASEVKDRVVAIGPTPDRVRPGADEVERRSAAERTSAMRQLTIVLVLFFGWMAFDGLWFDVTDEHTRFGYSRGRRLGDSSPMWPFLALVAYGYGGTAVDAWRRRGTPRAAVLRCKLMLGLVFGFGGLALWVAARTNVTPGITGSPFANALGVIVIAAMIAYALWTHAVEHRVPARLVFGPLWWIHAWEAELEPRTKR